VRTIENNFLKFFRTANLINDSAHYSFKALLKKIDFLSNTGRYQKLLSEFRSCNNKDNLLGLILETTFAYHFESKDKPLIYEVRQSDDLTSVDFLRVVNDNLKLYFELRLIQQRQCITQVIQDQIKQIIDNDELDSRNYGYCLDGVDQKNEIKRLQRIILSKCQDKNGNLVKFYETCNGNCNIIVVGVSDIVLGVIDKWDCLLATYGDPAVPEVIRRGVFGLFQCTHPSYQKHIQELSKSFSNIRSIIHGILFIKRKPNNNKLDFQIEHCFIPNFNLLTEETICSVKEELDYALLSWD
jgi:hypothetical protein